MLGLFSPLWFCHGEGKSGWGHSPSAVAKCRGMETQIRPAITAGHQHVFERKKQWDGRGGWNLGNVCAQNRLVTSLGKVFACVCIWQRKRRETWAITSAGTSPAGQRFPTSSSAQACGYLQSVPGFLGSSRDTGSIVTSAWLVVTLPCSAQRRERGSGKEVVGLVFSLAKEDLVRSQALQSQGATPHPSSQNCKSQESDNWENLEWNMVKLLREFSLHLHF